MQFDEDKASFGFVFFASGNAPYIILLDGRIGIRSIAKNEGKA